MAKSVGYNTIVLVVASLLIASLAIPMVEATDTSHMRYCKTASTSFKGICHTHAECDKTCRDVEKKKQGGLCRSDGAQKKCFCYGC
uniref:defensin Tk-AMP-D1-like n=1 Tax=Fragaria vesca subsp. vesca TaxID=101020 RepID=UPI0005CB7639|nr:PREDICTED: defensin Tk-AMP-D1-like [Fragaria vesca subsp. vesca]